MEKRNLAERKVLLSERGAFGREDSKKLFDIIFEVPRGCGALEVFFDYSPRKLEDGEENRRLILRASDEYTEGHRGAGGERLSKLVFETLYKMASPLRNLLNLSLYDPWGRFRGRWDRNAEWQDPTVSIRAGDASPGMLPLPITPGRWRVSLEVHVVVTSECQYSLEICSLPEGHKTRHPKSPRRSPKKGTQPGASRGRAWYGGELHVHSVHSDGDGTIPDIVEAAKNEGYDFIALTDHNTTTGHRELRDLGDDFPVIKGIEFTTFFGHATALGIKSFIDWREGNRIKDINDLIDEVHGQNALFSIAHPFTVGDPVCTGCRWKFENVDFSGVDLMEVWAGPWAMRRIENHNSFLLWNKLLNEGKFIVGISGRDWHKLRDDRKEGLPRTYVLSRPNPARILKGLRRGRVFVSSGPRVYFGLRCGGKRFGVGDSATLPPGTRLELVVDVEGLAGEGTLNIVRDGEVWRQAKVVPGGGKGMRFEDKSSGDRWYRCELYKTYRGDPISDLMLAFTNPIFVSTPQ
ncbi:MAG: CehA/McbA family metallohydrolase [bacterium]